MKRILTATFLFSVLALSSGSAAADCSYVRFFGLAWLTGYNICHVIVTNLTEYEVEVVVHYRDDDSGKWITTGKYSFRPSESANLTSNGESLDPEVGSGTVFYWARNITTGETWEGNYRKDGYNFKPAKLTLAWMDARIWEICLGSRCGSPSSSVSERECKDDCSSIADNCRLKYAHEHLRLQQCTINEKNCRSRCR